MITAYEHFRYKKKLNQPKHPAILRPARSRPRPCTPLPAARSGWAGGQSLNGAWPLTTERKTEIGKKNRFYVLEQKPTTSSDVLISIYIITHLNPVRLLKL